MSQFQLKNGMELYYEDIGEGKPVILMHGWTSNHTIYTEPVKLLAGKGRFIYYDHRGHGGSKSANREPASVETLASDLHEMIETLGLSDVTLVGWSMGAATAMTYIRDYGCDALRQVVLCDMTPKQINDADWHLGLYQGQYTQADATRDTGGVFLDLYEQFAVGAMPRLKRLPRFILRIILKKRLKNCDEAVLRSLSASMKAQDHREVIEKITVPLTYFYAVPGSLFSPELAKWYEQHAQVPFRSVPFADSTHMFISEHPAEFAQALGKLL